MFTCDQLTSRATPDDDYDALKDFNEAYEGHETPLEALHLEFQKLLAKDSALAARLDRFVEGGEVGQALPHGLRLQFNSIQHFSTGFTPSGAWADLR